MYVHLSFSCTMWLARYRDVAEASQVDLSYHRVPVTDERAMKFIDFEEITQIIVYSYYHVNMLTVQEKIFLSNKDKEMKTAIVFNCQMGQGTSIPLLLLLLLIL
jgi:hypothetical protein